MIAAIRRVVEAAAGHAMILARGDADAGQIVVVAITPAGERAYERVPAHTEAQGVIAVGPEDRDGLADYLERRRRSDPDLWVLEITDLADPVAIFGPVLG